MGRRDEVLVTPDRAAGPGWRAVEWQSGGLVAAPRRDVPDQAGVAALLAAAGAGPEVTLALHGPLAAHAFWLLRYRGFDRMRLVDPPEPAPAAQSAVAPADPGPLAPARHEMRAFRDDVLVRIGDRGAAIVDAREPGEAASEGWIPGAIGVPASALRGPGGALRPDRELADLFADAGVTPERDVVTYCGHGSRAALTWFALRELLGYERVRLYDGSWAEYRALVGVPVDR